MSKKLLYYLLGTSYVVGFYLIFVIDKDPFLTKLGYGIVMVNIVVMAALFYRKKSEHQ
jgi:hypothetical protein